MFTLIVFLLTLSILVLVHELGHFLAARKAGIKVEEFGLGYPPRAWAKKIGETVYSLNWIPFGGFVKLFGEELGERKAGKRAFWSKSKKARTVVIIAGVLANFLLSIILFSIVYSSTGIPTKTDQVIVVAVAENSPAEKLGIREDDILLSVDEQNVRGLEEFIKLVEEKKGQSIELQLKDRSVEITPREDPPEGEGALGVVVSDMEMKKYPLWEMIPRGAIEGIREALMWGWLTFTSIAKMLIDWLGKGVAPKDVAGPVGIYQITGTVARQGILPTLQFIGIFSINLAVLNILPFPALDGGRLLFVIYEVIFRKRPRWNCEGRRFSF